MFGNHRRADAQSITFLLLENFSMMAFTSSIEPLRAANRLSGRTLYQWKTLSMDGGDIAASNNVTIRPDGSLLAPVNADVLFVCAGLHANRVIDQTVCRRLRELSRSCGAMGSVCTGSIALACAGLLDGYRCTIHWENIEGFAESFPRLNVSATLFEIDRNRYTCSGGTAPLDMMLYSIAKDHGNDLAIATAEQMLHNFVREPHDHQRMTIQHRTGITNPKLLAAIAHMEAHIETPSSVTDIASSVNLSPRQLERLFRKTLNKTPARYYLELRLHKAKLLLEQTSMPILQIAVATGFSSPAHFTKTYRSLFTHPPSAERMQG